MRLFCAIEVEPIPGNRLWQNNIVLALKEMGHEVIPFDYPIDAFYRHAERIPDHLRWVAKHRPGLEKALLEQIRNEHEKKPVDIFFSYFYSAHCTAPTIQAIRERGIKTMNWYCNASYQLDLVADLAPAYDLCLIPEKNRLENYRKLGAHPFHCQEAANPAFYRDLGITRDLGVVFIGQNYATRSRYACALYNSGLPIDVWGRDWTWEGTKYAWPRVRWFMKNTLRCLKQMPIYNLPRERCHGFLADEEMVRIYNRSKIALGFGVVHSRNSLEAPVFQIRLRDFEAPMCGTFYLTEYQEELTEFFELGKEIETFRNQEELIDKARFYLTNNAAREKVSLAGRARCLRDHTWQKRLQEAFVVLNA